MKAYVSSARYVELRRMLDADTVTVKSNPLVGSNVFMGMELRTSPAFPHRMDCAMCDGTGKGASSTYCPTCRGGGATIVDGYIEMSLAQRSLLVSYLPRRFAPSFPPGLVPPRNPVRIVA